MSIPEEHIEIGDLVSYRFGGIGIPEIGIYLHYNKDAVFPCNVFSFMENKFVYLKRTEMKLLK